MFNNSLPTSASSIELNSNFSVIESSIDSTDNIFDNVNCNGTCDIVGWAKPGVVIDQATAPGPGDNPFQPGPMQQEHQLVGTINNHIVSIVPSTSNTINTAQLAGYKVDVAASVGRAE